MSKRVLSPLTALLGRSIRQLYILPLRYWLLTGSMYAVLDLWVSPLISRLLLAAVHQAGLATLTDRTMSTLLTSPASLGILAGTFIIISAATLLSFATMLIIADLQFTRQPPSITAVAGRLLHLAKKAYRPGAPIVAAELALLAPLVGYTLFAPVTGNLGIPPFIGREYMKTPLSALLLIAAAAVVIVIIYVSILTMPFALVRNQTLGRSFIDSVRAIRQGGIRLALTLAVAALGALLVSRGGAWLLGRGVDALNSRFDHTSVAVTAATFAFASLSLATAQGFANLFAGEARIFYKMPFVSTVTKFNVRAPLSRGTDARTALRSAVVIALICGTGAAVIQPAMATIQVTEPAPTSSGNGQALVIGHRGYDSGGVENTLGGLVAAAAMKTDMVEADFQQTSDGVFVASHDTNLLVLAGKNQNIYEMTAAEVAATTVTMKGHSGTIPTMAAYVQMAHDIGMPLLIELKVTGHEKPGYVEDFLAELDAVNGFEGNIFHSLNPAAVERIKTMRPELRVGLTIGLLYGSLPTTPCDFYVIEQASLTSEMIEAAHGQGKDVYSWTVNGELSMRALLRAGVDGLVTDHPDLAQGNRDELSPGSDYVDGDVRNQLLLESRSRQL
ncbi:glycerophosphodiester phosphodiesterase family protein [Arthrobacter sp. TWP1-1]|uniref:glycerophosphodiester phosphodiesterase family protein n=1 Tax=Arthrobacter sp. TWP1-1 TaxID=2804568 RepID=UPI003CEAE102